MKVINNLWLLSNFCVYYIPKWCISVITLHLLEMQSFNAPTTNMLVLELDKFFNYLYDAG